MYLKKTLFLTLGCFLLFSALAQQPIAAYQFNPGKLAFAEARISYQDNCILASIVYPDGTDKIFLENDSVQTQLQQEKMSNTTDTANRRHFILKKDHENISLPFLASVVENNIWVDCNYAQAQKTVYISETNLITGITHTTDTISFQEKESVLNIIADNKTLFIVSIVEKSDRLNIYVKKAGSKIKGFEKTIQLSSPADQNRRAKKLADFFIPSTDEPFILLDGKQTYPAWASAAQSKIYHQPGKMVFSIESPYFETYLIVLNLPGFSHTIKKYSFVDQPYVLQNTKDNNYCNSFLKDSILTKIGKYGDDLLLSTTNVQSGKLIHYTHLSLANGQPAIAASPLFLNARVIVNNTKDSSNFKRLINTSLATVACSAVNDSLYTIELCLYYSQRNWANLLAVLALRATAVSTGVDWIGGLNPFSLYRVTDKMRTYRVQNILDIKTGHFEPARSKDQDDSWPAKIEQVNDFISTHTSKGVAPEVHIFNKTAYVSFLDKASGKFFIYKF